MTTRCRHFIGRLFRKKVAPKTRLKGLEVKDVEAKNTDYTDLQRGLQETCSLQLETSSKRSPNFFFWLVAEPGPAIGSTTGRFCSFSRQKANHGFRTKEYLAAFGQGYCEAVPSNESSAIPSQKTRLTVHAVRVIFFSTQSFIACYSRAQEWQTGLFFPTAFTCRFHFSPQRHQLTF